VSCHSKASTLWRLLEASNATFHGLKEQELSGRLVFASCAQSRHNRSTLAHLDVVSGNRKRDDHVVERVKLGLWQTDVAPPRVASE
jgi:hypothetical protein